MATYDPGEETPPTGKHHMHEPVERDAVSDSEMQENPAVIQAQSPSTVPKEPPPVTDPPPAPDPPAASDPPPASDPPTEKNRQRASWRSWGSFKDNPRARRASLIGGGLIALLLAIAIGASVLANSSGVAGESGSVPQTGRNLVSIPAGAHRLGADDLNKACVRIYGANSTASYVQNSGPVPSYWIKCNGNQAQSLGIEEYCQAVYGTHAENPYRYDADISKKPWDWWYCQP